MLTHSSEFDSTARIAELEMALIAAQSLTAAERASFEQRIASLEAERARLQASYDRLRQELTLLKRRIFVGKAERVDVQQLELEFAAKLRELEIAAGTLGVPGDSDEDPKDEPKRPKPKGRRSLKNLKLPVETVEISDPELDQLVADGKATRHGVEESRRIAHKRGGRIVLITQRVKYKLESLTGATVVQTTALPKEILSRCIATPSLLAHTIIDKIGYGLPLFRQEQRFAAEGLPIDRSSLSRWHDELGGAFGATLVHAMRDDAMKTAFCIATDATGIAVQPIRTHEKKRKPCKRGHYLVQIADRDAVFFEYLERETSAAIGKLFQGFSGYVQADAKSVFDALFQPPDDGAVDDDLRKEVGCWSTRAENFGKRPLPRAPSRARACVESDAFSSSTRLGEASRPQRSSGCATRTCDRTSTRFSPGPRSSTSWSGISADCLAPRSATSCDKSSRSRVSSTTAASYSRTTAPSARSAPSPSAARTGCSPAATTTRRAPLTSSRLSRPRACTSSTPRPTSAISSACCRTGLVSASSSSRPSTGSPPANASTLSSSSERSA